MPCARGFDKGIEYISHRKFPAIDPDKDIDYFSHCNALDEF